MLPTQGKAKGVYHHQAIIIWNVKGIYLKKTKKIKTMNIKMVTNSQLPTNEQQQKKKNKEKKLSKQLEQG